MIKDTQILQPWGLFSQPSFSEAVKGTFSVWEDGSLSRQCGKQTSSEIMGREKLLEINKSSPQVILILKPAGTQSHSCAESRSPGLQQDCCVPAPRSRDLAQLSHCLQLSPCVSCREGVKTLMRPIRARDDPCAGTQSEVQTPTCRHLTYSHCLGSHRSQWGLIWLPKHEHLQVVSRCSPTRCGFAPYLPPPCRCPRAPQAVPDSHV